MTARLRASGRFAAVHALSRSGTGLDLEDEASIAAAAARVSEGPPPALIFVATGVLHDGHAPERTYRALSADHLLRDYRVNVVGPALVAKHFLPLVPRDRPAAFAALSARVGSIGDNRLGGWHAYRASKAALNMLLKTAAIEMARTHPQAVLAALHPGTVDSALSAPFRGAQIGRPAADAARDLLAVLDGLRPEDSGGFWAYDGQRLPW